MRNLTRFLLTIVFTIILMSCKSLIASDTFEGVPQQCHQLIYVKPTGKAISQAVLYQFQRKDCSSKWEKVVGPLDIYFGRNGVAPLGTKREGDGKTPEGIYSVTETFGFEPEPEMKMPYYALTDDMVWVSESKDARYNQLFRDLTHEYDGKNVEHLRKIGSYKYVGVVDYNRNPIIPGWGSAIFIHSKSPKRKDTSGCVALDFEDMKRLIFWLQPDLHPYIKIEKQ